ncbi:MAG: glycerol-3-phosphate acyltransferase [Anaerolineae bacterium]|nr:glycerol-3-phosphate acyltransferase [Anaerolineae bacterium]
MLVALVAISYLVGSIPVAWLIGKMVTGQDLRQVGSGNVGVLNTAVSVARWAGLLVFVAEAAKGAMAVTLARAWVGGEVAVGLAALAAIVGTRWSIWLRGAGGRGNTAAMTALLLISWPTMVGVLTLWFLLRFLTGSNFIATRASLILLPVIFGLITHSWWSVLFGAIFSLLFMSTHRPETDDHLLIKGRWPGLWAFLTAPRRK